MDVSWSVLKDITLRTEAFKTLMGTLKAKNQLPNIQSLCYPSSLDNQETIDAAREYGFKQKIAIPNCLLVHLKKSMPGREPFSPAGIKNPQALLAKTSKAVSTGTKIESLLPSSETQDFSTPFKVGEHFPSASEIGPKICMRCVPKINLKYLAEDKTVPGFAIFKATGTRERIGSIVPHYNRSPQWIEIQAVSIEQKWRDKQYGSQAVRTFMDIHSAKKECFPKVEYFFSLQ